MCSNFCFLLFFKFLATSSSLTKLYLAQEQREKDELALLCLCGYSTMAPARWATLCPATTQGNLRQLRVSPGYYVPRFFKCYKCRVHPLLPYAGGLCWVCSTQNFPLGQQFPFRAGFSCALCTLPTTSALLSLGKSCGSCSHRRSRIHQDSTDWQDSDSFQFFHAQDFTDVTAFPFQLSISYLQNSIVQPFLLIWVHTHDLLHSSLYFHRGIGARLVLPGASGRPSASQMDRLHVRTNTTLAIHVLLL